MAIKVHGLSKFLTGVVLITVIGGFVSLASAENTPPPHAYAPSDWNSATAKLGLKPTATETEIKTAFRKATRSSHPDIVGNNSKEEEFKAYYAAYQYLKERNFKSPVKEAPAGSSQSASEGPTGKTHGPQKPMALGELIAFIVNGSWATDKVTSANLDGSFNTYYYRGIREFSRVASNPRNLNRVVVVHTKPQYQLSRIAVEFENGTVLLENNVVAGAQAYAFEVPGHASIGKSVHVNYVSFGRIEKVLHVFADGSIQTDQNLLVQREHYATEASKPLKLGRTVMVQHQERGPFGLQRWQQVEKILQAFDGDYYITDRSKGRRVHASNFAEEIIGSPLVGSKVMVNIEFRSEAHLVEMEVKKHFADGSVYFGEQERQLPSWFYTSSVMNFPTDARAGDYAKEVKQSPLIGKICLLRDPRKWQVAKIQRLYENGSVSTNLTNASANSYSIESSNHPLTGQTVYVREPTEYVKRTVQRVFEDGTLLTGDKSLIEPNTYEVTKPSDRVGESIIVFDAEGSYRTDTVQDVVGENSVIDSTGAKLNPGQFQTLVTPEWSNQPIILRRQGKWVEGAATYILKSGAVLGNDGKFYAPADYLYPVASTLIGTEVQVPRWLGLGMRTEKVTHVFEDGSIMTEKSGYVRSYNTVTRETPDESMNQRSEPTSTKTERPSGAASMTCETLLGRKGI